MHSALYALDAEQHLWRFEWGHFQGRPCSQLETLGVSASEKVKLVAVSKLRMTVVLQSGRVVTMMDPLTHLACPSDIELGHAAMHFKELEGEALVEVTVNAYMSMVLTATGKVFRWGMQPPLEMQAVANRLYQLESEAPPPVLAVGTPVRFKQGRSLPQKGAQAVYFGLGTARLGG